jgi:hypothetical protein
MSDPTPFKASFADALCGVAKIARQPPVPDDPLVADYCTWLRRQDVRPLVEVVETEFNRLHRYTPLDSEACVEAFWALGEVACLYREIRASDWLRACWNLAADYLGVGQMLDAVVRSGNLGLLPRLLGRPVWLGALAARCAARCDLHALELLLSFPEAETEMDPDCARQIVEELARWASKIPGLVASSAAHIRSLGGVVPASGSTALPDLVGALKERLQALGPEALKDLSEQDAERQVVEDDSSNDLEILRWHATRPEFSAAPLRPSRLEARRRPDDEPLDPLTGVMAALLGLFPGGATDERAPSWYLARMDAGMVVYLTGLVELAFASGQLREAAGRLPEARLACLREWGGARRRWTPLRATWVGAVAASAVSAAEAALAAALADA